MKEYKRLFLNLIIEYDALEFKPRKLNSGRISPYFLNMGVLCDAAALVRVGDCYAEALLDKDLVSEEIFPALLGPPYKGILLAAATMFSLHRSNPLLNLSLASFRKEKKDHGEEGFILWASLEGGQHVVILDDVVSRGGTAIDAVAMARKHGAFVDGVLLGFDRQERGMSGVSAISEIQKEIAAPVVSIAGYADLKEFIREDPRYRHHLSALADYYAEYGAIQT